MITIYAQLRKQTKIRDLDYLHGIYLKKNPTNYSHSFQLHPLLTLLVESKFPPQNSTLASKEFLFFLSVHIDKGEFYETPEKVYKGVSIDATHIAVLTNIY